MTMHESRGHATIWVADGSPVPGLDYGTRIEERLNESGVSSSIRHWSATFDDAHPPSGLNILTGGSTSVNDLTTWMPTGLWVVRRLIQSAMDGHSELFGICLGAQMIAECLAPGCITRGKRCHVGLVPFQWKGDLKGGDSRSVLPSFHYEQIEAEAFEASGSEVLASRDEVPVIAYRHGDRIGGIQLHPELTARDATGLVETHSSLIEKLHGDVSTSRARVEELSDHLSPNAFHHALNTVMGDNSATRDKERDP